MKHRQYPSYDDAVTALEQLGTLKLWGRIGADHDHYTLTIQGRVYRLFVYQSGLVEWREDIDKLGR